MDTEKIYSIIKENAKKPKLLNYIILSQKELRVTRYMHRSKINEEINYDINYTNDKKRFDVIRTEVKKNGEKYEELFLDVSRTALMEIINEDSY